MIALALACQPSLVIADEPTTALDVVMQAQVLQLLERLREQLGLALILISHDLGVLAETCDRIAIMYAGRIVETGPVRAVFDAPQHPYTKRLLDSLPVIGGERGLADPIPGGPPDPGDLPEGCRFRPRCPYAAERCFSDPPLREVSPGQAAACHFAPWTEWPHDRDDHAGGERMSESLMEVRDLAVEFRGHGARGAGGRRRLARVAARRDPRGGGGVRAAASRRLRGRCSACSSPPPGRWRSTARRLTARAAWRAAPARADDLPGPLPDAQPAPAGGRDRHRAAGRPGRGARRARGARAARARGRRASSPSASPTATRTSSRAASASGSRSRRPSCSSPRG